MKVIYCIGWPAVIIGSLFAAAIDFNYMPARKLIGDGAALVYDDGCINCGLPFEFAEYVVRHTQRYEEYGFSTAGFDTAGLYDGSGDSVVVLFMPFKMTITDYTDICEYCWSTGFRDTRTKIYFQLFDPPIELNPQ